MIDLIINVKIFLFTVFTFGPGDLFRSDDCISQWFYLKRLSFSFSWIEHDDRWDKLKSRAIWYHIDLIAHSYFQGNLDIVCGDTFWQIRNIIDDD